MKNFFFAKLSRRYLLFISWFFLFLAAFNFTADIPTRSHSFMIIVDVTLSMNTKDMKQGLESKSRISYIRDSLEQAVRELPCGTKIGLGIFAGYQSSFLFNPVEICTNYSDLVRSFSFLETNMIWAGDSEIAKGIYNSMKIINKLDPDIRLVFLTDGHEAPPIAPAYRPRFDKTENKVKGLIVGVGNTKKSKIPKINSEGEEYGYWSAEEVMQFDPFSTGRKGSDSNEKLVDNESALIDPRLITRIQASPGTEHLTQLREDYLNLLAAELNFKYVRLTDSKHFAKNMLDLEYSEWRKVESQLSGLLGSIGLILLLFAYFPRLKKIQNFFLRVLS
ncbi:MAG: hypothetical protein CBD16_00560 [Betaproteobacteria bacterium TMED156]|nr:MAG: hypothetical protein CBD16_00560 [Betaproteobacteria bacterium TMED156]